MSCVRVVAAFCVLLGCSTSAHAQTPMFPYSFADFTERVVANHPVARQARLLSEQAGSAVTEAWGAFEPKLSLSIAQKTYKSQSYYSYVDAALKIPTPIGSDFKIGFERASGIRISPDRYTPTNGLLSLGISVPLGQRLITDERRTALALARAAREIANADQRAIVNKLLLDAAKTYGAWYAASRRFEIAEEGVRLATFRADAVLRRVRAGDNPAIDTLEATLEVQRRQVARAESDNELRTAALVASSFLWDDRGRAEAIAANAQPALEGLEQTPIDTLRLTAWLDVVSARHPDVLKARGKLRAAEAERLLALQGMLPFAEGTLSSIAARDDAKLLGSTSRWDNNHKAGLEVQSGLLLLKERGKSARTRQKRDVAQLDVDITEREVAYELRIALNDVVLLERVIAVQRATVRGLSLLRDAEQQRFQNGESTLLIVNLRERALLDESNKLATLEGKIAATRGALVVALGDASLISGK